MIIGRWLAVWGLLLACVVACGDDDASPSGEGGGNGTPPPAASPGEDGGDSSMGSGGQASGPRDGGAFPLPAISGQVCALEVGASCDGSEDCADGQRCCAQFEPVRYRYTRIGCADSCDQPDQFELCHPGDTCRRDKEVCRRSVIVPHDFITVCAPEVPFVEPEDAKKTKSVSLEGEVVCGDDTCTAGDQVCCLRSNFDFATTTLSALPPYCAPAGSACTCDPEPPIVDASVEDGG